MPNDEIEIQPPVTGFVDRNGTVICYHDILINVNNEQFYVSYDRDLQTCLIRLKGYTKEGLTPTLSRQMQKLNL